MTLKKKEEKNKKDIVKILSFDPALTVTGWAFSEFDKKTGIFTVKEYGILRPAYMASKDKEGVKKFGQRPIALSIVEKESLKLYNSYLPDIVVSEDAFFNSFRPSAYLTLIMCIYIFERMCFNHNKQLYKIAPRSVKLITCGNGSADKLMINESIKNNDKIVFNKGDKKEIELIEHISDAIAIGYSWSSQSIMEIIEE